MSPTIETTQTQEAPDCNGAMADYIEKMMGLKLSKLQKIAKKKGIADEAIQGAATGAENEEDAKEVLIQMLLKAQSMKLKMELVPSPTRARKPAPSLEEEMKAQTCLLCPGCIRPPKHEGNCMDGQCNDIFLPESPKKESGIDGAAEAARHKEIKWEQQRKMEEMNRLEDEAQERKEARCKEEARRKAAQAAEAEARCQEEARIKAAQEAAAAEARKKVEEEEARRKAEQAARQKALAEGVARRKAADEEARRKAAEADEEQALRVKAAEEAQRQAAEEEAKEAELQEAQRQAAEEEAKEAELWRAAVEVAEKEARDKKAQEEKAAEAEEDAREAARARRRAAEEVAMAEMDERCVETFLSCVTCDWREPIRTPLKGSNLYTKHIRPCRPAGTSVDIKDSGFRSLGNFLQFLENEGLLRLKPGLSDPVVTQIRIDACRKYKYVARPQSSPAKEATQEEYFTPQSTPVKEVSLRPQCTPSSASRMLSFQ